jgi:2-C-methyl-D-erythritol 4-phosphate cytidylyltransferase
MYYENKNYFRDLKDKVFVIFGGKRGIGRRISEIASDFGAKVYSFSRKNNVNIKSPINVRRALSSVWEKEGRIDFIVNTAAILNMGLLENREYPSIFDEINTNYLGNIIIIKEGIKYLEKSKGAFLLFSSSSYTRGRALYSVYSSTKAAVVNLMQAMSEELISKNIKINVINPERTNTEMRRENFGKEDPKTLLDPDKVAWISIKTLLSDITGQVIDVRIDDEENDIKSF